MLTFYRITKLSVAKTKNENFGAISVSWYLYKIFKSSSTFCDFLVQFLKLLKSFHSTLFPNLLLTLVRLDLALGKRIVVRRKNSGAATSKNIIALIVEKTTVLLENI